MRLDRLKGTTFNQSKPLLARKPCAKAHRLGGIEWHRRLTGFLQRNLRTDLALLLKRITCGSCGGVLKPAVGAAARSQTYCHGDPSVPIPWSDAS